MCAGFAPASSAQTYPAPSLAACNATEFATVLQAPPKLDLEVNGAAAPDAAQRVPQAVWLSRHLVQWPDARGAKPSAANSATASGTTSVNTAPSADPGRYKLYHSASGQLQALVGQPVQGADGALVLARFGASLPTALAKRFKFVSAGVVLQLDDEEVKRLPKLVQQQLLVVQEDASGRVLRSAPLQWAGLLDDLFTPAGLVPDLGATPKARETTFKLWAPTAQAVALCRFDSSTGAANALQALQRDDAAGIWIYHHAANLQGEYYTYLVDVWVPGTGLVRNRVTDPYSVSLNADSQRSYVADLNHPSLQPAGWKQHPRPKPLAAAVDMTIYELHVRDFSMQDTTVPLVQRGKYVALTQARSNGMRHLQALAQAGVTDVHLLPIFDIATISETGCVSPAIETPARGDSEAPQAAVVANAAQDCFNWGYDPFHFSAPEGSYATDSNNAATRILELRRMVMALHRLGLRVGMDMVYNHTTVSGQNARSVLDRIVPGYYQRLDAFGAVERSTCCDNTATENLMMGKLMQDSVALWTQAYRMDSFRFDLMAHQPHDAMVALQARVNKVAGRSINLIGEGWNFGEVADGARFVQASQLSLNGTGIATFSDRGRDAVRGGGAGDNGSAQISNQGYINGMVYDRNALSQAKPDDLLRTADMVRVGLAGSLRDFQMLTFTGQNRKLSELDYGGGQPAGYVSQPGEVVNYIENHDNQTLYDINMFRLPTGTSMQDRVRVQMLGVAINALSQGIAYFHAGTEVLRSKSLDRNSFDSGDWFNRLDWSYQTNYFGTGLPPKPDNAASWPLMAPLLPDPANRPAATDIAMARDSFNDLLKIRASTTLLRLRTAADIQERLSFRNIGPGQNPVVLVGHVQGTDRGPVYGHGHGRGHGHGHDKGQSKLYPGSVFQELLYLVNVDPKTQTLVLPQEVGKTYQLHPVHTAARAADVRAREARYEKQSGQFTVPGRTAVVFVVR